MSTLTAHQTPRIADKPPMKLYIVLIKNHAASMLDDTVGVRADSAHLTIADAEKRARELIRSKPILSYGSLEAPSGLPGFKSHGNGKWGSCLIATWVEAVDLSFNLRTIEAETHGEGGKKKRRANQGEEGWSGIAL